jgi:hypothetical protein
LLLELTLKVVDLLAVEVVMLLQVVVVPAPVSLQADLRVVTLLQA